MRKTQRYDLLKSAIATKPVNRQELEFYKSLFKDNIQSKRRYACIKSFEDLFDLLERYGCLSEYNIKPLQEIAETYADDEIDMALEKYQPPPEPNNFQNLYALQRIQERSSSIADFKCDKLEIEQKPIKVLEFTNKKRNDIYKLISRDIGRDWRSFGRELLVRGGDLDSIDVKHPNDLQSKVYEIFKIFEDDPRQNSSAHYIIICDALDNCKRKDIRRDVQQIMSN